MQALSPAKDYLQQLPLPKSLIGSSALLQSELKRVAEHKQLNSIDLQKGEDHPQPRSLSQTIRANDKQKILMEYNTTRHINLALSNKFSAHYYKIYCKKLSEY